jgi:WbqC-like protein family
MVLSIHQASYFPWLGLLDKIRKSAVYMVMDDVQLSDKAYQHRNIFLTADGQVKFLTIPFVKKDYLSRRFREIEIAQEDWRVKHFNFILNTYRKHSFAREIFPRLELYYATEQTLLCSAVLASMRLSFDLFGISTPMILQSQMQYDRSLRGGDLVYALVRAAGADCYLSGTGARAYLDESLFKDGIMLRYNDFVHPRYAQKGRAEFQPNLSCLDALFNLGIDGARGLLEGAQR